MSVSPVSVAGQNPAPSAGEGVPVHVVARGDSLWRIAERLQHGGTSGSTAEVVAALLRLNPSIRDPDRIELGETLRLPGALPTKADGAAAGAGRSPPRTAATSPSVRASPRAPSASASEDGTPCFRQADAAWRDVRLGSHGPTLARAGCAVTSCAMAVSKLTGAVVTPAEVASRLAAKGGLDAAGRIVWSRAATELGVGLGNPRQPWSLERLRSELAAGRPVVVGVHKGAASAGADPAHWICVTRHDPRTDSYWANDPATGRETELRLDHASGTLITPAGARVAYRSAGRMITFA